MGTIFAQVILVGTGAVYRIIIATVIPQSVSMIKEIVQTNKNYLNYSCQKQRQQQFIYFNVTGGRVPFQPPVLGRFDLNFFKSVPINLLSFTNEPSAVNFIIKS